jgi:CubicO group peptidase (beta-lactamase class C family)
LDFQSWPKETWQTAAGAERTNLVIEQVCNRNVTFQILFNSDDFAEYFKGLNRRHPVFLSQSTPVYSNTAFRILSYAMEVITGETYENIVMQSIVEPLGLAHTTVFKPQDNSAGVIPQGDSSWEFNVGDEAP